MSQANNPQKIKLNLKKKPRPDMSLAVPDTSKVYK